MSGSQKQHSYFPRASNASVLATFIAIVGCFMIMALIVWLAYLPNREDRVTVDMSQVSEDQQWKFTEEGRVDRLVQMRAKETELLGSYSWVDQSSGKVRVPIDRAIELVVAEQREARR